MINQRSEKYVFKLFQYVSIMHPQFFLSLLMRSFDCMMHAQCWKHLIEAICNFGIHAVVLNGAWTALNYIVKFHLSLWCILLTQRETRSPVAGRVARGQA
jgi:hypothetical protein